MLDGVVYKLCCLDENIKEFYIGSSCEFNKRKGYHNNECNNPNSVKYNLKVYRFIRNHGGFDNWYFEILLEVKVESRKELRLNYESKYQVNLKPELNVKVEGRTPKQYREDHKERIKEVKKNYYKNNKEIINNRNNKNYEKNSSQKYTCQCGIILTKKSKLRHERRKRHLEYLESVK